LYSCLNLFLVHFSYFFSFVKNFSLYKDPQRGKNYPPKGKVPDYEDCISTTSQTPALQANSFEPVVWSSFS